MKLDIIEAISFSKALGSFIKKRLLSKEDFESFKKFLADNPEIGDMIPGTGGTRKIRLKGFSTGKSGGFRVCYYYLIENSLYLLLIYAKNEQENLTTDEKKQLRTLVKTLKGKI